MPLHAGKGRTVAEALSRTTDYVKNPEEVKWPAAEQERYHSILKRADDVVYVSRIYHPDCMLERNRYMAVHSSVLLAVYNGTQRSGTGATVNYARKLGQEIITIDPITLMLSHEKAALYPVHTEHL